MPAVSAAPARRIGAAGVVLLALFVCSPADAIPIGVDGGWSSFSWTGGVGPIDAPADGFQFTAVTSVEVQITDCCLIGDRFEIFVNSDSVGPTSATAPADFGVPSGSLTGPASWADSRLSKRSLVLAAGSYDIDLSVTTSVVSTGGGFIQVLTSVPEPSVLVLLALGLAGLLWVTRPEAQRSARPSSAKR